MVCLYIYIPTIVISSEDLKTFKKTSIQSATKLESHNNNFHIKTKANINTASATNLIEVLIAGFLLIFST